MITEDQLIERGYKRFRENVVVWPHAIYFYQKLFADEEGKKYFINLVCYPAILEIPASWMCEVTHNDPHSTFQQHSVADLDLAEERCEKSWDLMGKPYYERNE